MNLEIFLEKYRAEYIQSRSNKKTVEFSKLAEKKYRDQSRLFLAEGVKLAEEALKFSKAGVECVIVAETAVKKASDDSPYDRVTAIAKTANELDVQLSKDDKLVVFHDATLKRMCNVEGHVWDYTLEELQKMQLKDSNETIPTLEQFLKVVNGKVPFILEFVLDKLGFSDYTSGCGVITEIE